MRARPTPLSRLPASRRPATAVVALLLALVAVLTLTQVAVADVVLPPYSYPRFLAYGSDGGLWFTEDNPDAPGSIDKIGRIEPGTGALTEYPVPGSSNDLNQIVAGPDGALWFTGLEEVGQITTGGSVNLWQSTYPEELVGLPEGIAAGPDGALWFTDNSNPAAIRRISIYGEVTRYALGSDLKLESIASGPDGALWFTEAGEAPSHPPDAIGRITTEGAMVTWSLPTQGSFPTNITTGPDGALWFTERVAHQIGRISTTGQIQEYPVPGALAPYAITAAPDAALWFTAGKDVGEITTTGQITMWTVPGSQLLNGIVAAPDGSFWLADGQGDAIRHFTPSSAPPPPPPAPSCAAYIVIDSRGSGERAGTTSPPGAAFSGDLQRRHHTHVAVIDNPYPAVGLWGGVRQLLNLIGAGLGVGPLGAYHASVVDGEKWLRDNVASEVAACPHSRVYLTGYSQGAQVTGDVYQRSLSAAERKHLIGVLLFGDPYFNPKDTTVDRGGYQHSGHGVLGRRHSFHGAHGVVSYCHDHDPVCHRPSVPELLRYGLKQHENYPADAGAAAKRF
jgi:virginiamycin B lyase